MLENGYVDGHSAGQRTGRIERDPRAASDHGILEERCQCGLQNGLKLFSDGVEQIL